MDESKKHLWCHGPRPEYELDSDWADQYYIPARTLPLLRSGRDLAIIPGRRPEVEAFALFCEEQLSLAKGQILRTSASSYLLDEDIFAELVPTIRSRCTPNDWHILPYSVTPRFDRWASQFDIPVFGDSAEFVIEYGHKGILHSRLSNPQPSLLAEFIPEVRVPQGYRCSTCTEMGDAWQSLGSIPALVKPIRAATGEGIFRLQEKDLREYSFPLGDVIIEELLPVEASVSVQFNGSEIFGATTDQSVDGFVWEGNIGPTEAAPEIQSALQRSTAALLGFLGERGLRGPGGFDFVISGGVPYLVDVNVGRFTGAHIPKIFHARYAPESSFESWKIDPPRRPLPDLFASLAASGIAFYPGRSEYGVFPLCYLPKMWGMLIVFGRNRNEASLLRKQAMRCL